MSVQATKLSESITAKSVCTECIFPASNACVIDFKAELLRYKSNKSHCKNLEIIELYGNLPFFQCNPRQKSKDFEYEFCVKQLLSSFLLL